MAEQPQNPYTTEDVIKNVNKFLKILEEEKMHPALFLHSLIFTSEFMIKRFGFIPKEIAEIRRQSREIIDYVDSAKQSETPQQH